MENSPSPEAIQSKILDFIHMSGDNNERVAAIQYLAILAIKGEIPEYIINKNPEYISGKFHGQAISLGLISKDGKSPDNIRQSLKDFFSNGKNTVINDLEDIKELERIYESVRFNLIVKQVATNGIEPTHGVAGIDNEGDSLLIKEIKTHKKSSPVTTKKENKTQNQAPNKAEKNNREKTMTEIVLERRKKNFGNWNKQHSIY